MKSLLVMGLLLIYLAEPANAYLEPTHRDMSEAAASASVLGNPADEAARQRRERLGWPRMDDKKLQYNNSNGTPGTLVDLIKDGALMEDEGIRGFNHFFDPRTGFAMRLDPARYPSVPAPVIALMNSLATTSPDWALGTYVDPVPAQLFAYDNLKTYYFDALTNRSTAEREQATGLAFQTLGHIIHHVQDMAQPQHSRNDAHISDKDIDKDCKTATGVKASLCDGYRRVRNKSFYESWVWGLHTEFFVPLPLSGYAPVYGPGAEGTTTFNAPRLFWTAFGRGMADFSSRNFATDGTMDQSPPALGVPFDMLAADLCNAAVPPCGAIDLTKKVTFWPSMVDDQLRPSSVLNPYAASSSIFTPDLRSHAPAAPPIKVVNRYTIHYDLAYLIPRAVGYSAGFINYFFRGDLEIALPDESVFAVVDMQSCGDPCGFRTAKLKMRNTTPGIEDFMGAGNLYLVARYRRNTCYAPDLAGEDGTPAFAAKGDACRSAENYIAVSNPVSVDFVDRNFGDATKFFFPDLAPIPIYASDLSLQVVFRGKLGQEKDAIAVSTLNVAEPNYLAVGNLTDYAFDDADDKYHRVPYKWNPTDVNLKTVQFSLRDPASGPFLATLQDVRGGEHAQLAFITARGTPKHWLHTASSEPYPQSDNVPWLLNEFFFDEVATPKYGRTCRVINQRGQWRQMAYHFAQLAHGFAAQDSPAEKLAILGAYDRGSRNDVAPKYHANCAAGVPQGSGGLYDFSVLTPLYSPFNQKNWAIQF
jgi:hypothetical protein